MNKAVMEILVPALRSGEFSQAQSKLQTSEGHCCLGVLCVLGERAGVPVARHPITGEILGVSLEDQEAVREWAGIRTPFGSYADGGALASFNDQGTGFSDIADIIERRWEEL